MQRSLSITKRHKEFMINKYYYTQLQLYNIIYQHNTYWGSVHGTDSLTPSTNRRGVMKVRIWALTLKGPLENYNYGPRYTIQDPQSRASRRARHKMSGPFQPRLNAPITSARPWQTDTLESTQANERYAAVICSSTPVPSYSRRHTTRTW